MKQFFTPEGIPFERLESYREVVDLLRRLRDDVWACNGVIEYRGGYRVQIAPCRREQRKSILLTGISRLVLFFADAPCVFYGSHLQVIHHNGSYRVAYYKPGSLEVF